jgi:hypothetical protein
MSVVQSKVEETVRYVEVWIPRIRERKQFRARLYWKPEMAAEKRSSQ